MIIPPRSQEQQLLLQQPPAPPSPSLALYKSGSLWADERWLVPQKGHFFPVATMSSEVLVSRPTLVLALSLIQSLAINPSTNKG